MTRYLLPFGVLALCACATAPRAPLGTVTRAQQDYNQALEKCQDEYRWDVNTDAGMGAAVTPDDTKFTQCLAPAKANLDREMRQAEAAEAKADAGSGA